jgi:hypothetical protein
MTERDLVTSLQTAIQRADPTWVSQPSHLRRRLEEELGVDARSHRSQIHQIIVAAEERIPVRLKRNGWSPTERDELGHLLVVTRGWTAGAADWAVLTWAAALGLTDDRPTATLAAAPAWSEPSPISERNPTAGLDTHDWGAATRMPPEFAAATEMPSQQFAEATELPPPAAVAPIKTPAERAPRIRTRTRLPRRGTRGCTRKCAKFLGQALDVAYVTKARWTPAFLLLGLPIAIAGLVIPTLRELLLVTYFVIMGFGAAFWPARIMAVAGDDVWLLSKKAGFSVKPTAVVSQGTRYDIEFVSGWPFPSVRFASEQLWFQYPTTGAARRLPKVRSC